MIKQVLGPLALLAGWIVLIAWGMSPERLKDEALAPPKGKHKVVVRFVDEKRRLVLVAPVVAVDLLWTQNKGLAVKGTILECEFPDPEKLPGLVHCDDGGNYSMSGVVWNDDDGGRR